MASKKLLITGAASGIGKALAEWADEQGDTSLILVDRDEAGIFALIDSLSCETMPIAGDVSSEDLWLSDVMRDSLQGLTGAALCAGVSDAGEIRDMHFDSWKRFMSMSPASSAGFGSV